MSARVQGTPLIIVQDGLRYRIHLPQVMRRGDEYSLQLRLAVTNLGKQPRRLKCDPIRMSFDVYNMTNGRAVYAFGLINFHPLPTCEDANLSPIAQGQTRIEDEIFMNYTSGQGFEPNTAVRVFVSADLLDRNEWDRSNVPLAVILLRLPPKDSTSLPTLKLKPYTTPWTDDSPPW